MLEHGGAGKTDRRFRVRPLGPDQARAVLCRRSPGSEELLLFRGPGIFSLRLGASSTVSGSEGRQKTERGSRCRNIGENVADRTETLFEGIRPLEPAHYLYLGAPGSRGTECRRYYDLDPSREIVYRNDDEYAAHFLTLFKEAVRCRLRSPKGVASDLSGGLDSSSIVCMAEKLRNDGEARVPGFETFSVRFEDGPAAEGQYVADVLRKYPHRHTDVAPGVASADELIRQVSHYLDMPDYPNGVCADYTPLLGQRDDLRARLTGLGGDEWFGGTYLIYADLIRQLRLSTLFERLRIDRNPPGGFAPFPGYGRVLVHYGLWRRPNPSSPRSSDGCVPQSCRRQWRPRSPQRRSYWNGCPRGVPCLDAAALPSRRCTNATRPICSRMRSRVMRAGTRIFGWKGAIRSSIAASWSLPSRYPTSSDTGAP